MTLSSTSGRHRRSRGVPGRHFAQPGGAPPDDANPARRRHHWSWPLRLVVAAGGLVVAAGVATLLAVLLGRPAITMSPSAQGLVSVRLSGWGADLSGVSVTHGSSPVGWTRHGGEIVPAHLVAQAVDVRVTATAAAPSWLHWLLGGPVKATRTVRTPTATTATAVAVGTTPGKVPVTFSGPVSVVSYRTAGGSARTVRLSHPSDVANLTVPVSSAAGTLDVSAAPRSWEQVTPMPRPITWFSVPPGSETVALADPAPGTTTATSSGPITLTFAGPVARILGTTHPTITPAVAGQWSEPGPDTLVFTPTGFGFGPGTAVTVTFNRPVRVVGATAAAGTGATTAAATNTYRFSVAPASVLRLEQILAQLHYLPLTFVPAAGAQVPTTFAQEVASMTQPVAGTFHWTWASTPASLQSEWSLGTPNLLLKGALMAFYSAQGNYDGYTVDPESVTQLADASTWDALLQAAAANHVDPQPYSYVYVTKDLPETLTLWENGSVVMTTAVNTGIPVDPTADGTFPIYERYSFNYMSGYNPDGSYYHDPVYWINYFNGGDAVHGFDRGSYGWPQSLGCVELPVSTAEVAFDHLAIGDLVTVAG